MIIDVVKLSVMNRLDLDDRNMVPCPISSSDLQLELSDPRILKHRGQRVRWEERNQPTRRGLKTEPMGARVTIRGSSGSIHADDSTLELDLNGVPCGPRREEKACPQDCYANHNGRLFRGPSAVNTKRCKKLQKARSPKAPGNHPAAKIPPGCASERPEVATWE